MSNYDLTRAAAEDLIGIWRYTFETWVFDQAEKYYDQLKACCEAIGRREARLKHIEGLPGGVKVHRCEKHYIFFIENGRSIIIAVLHGSMNFMKWLDKRSAK